MRSFRLTLVLVFFVLLAGSYSRAAEPQTLESTVLRLELTTSPYSFRILERSTGDLLLSHSGTLFTVNRYPVTAATDVTTTAKTLQATLLLGENGEKAHVTFTFVKPEVLQVLLTYGPGNPREISEQFDDQGEHYYGIWEYPFGKNIDTRGADQDFMGEREMPLVNYSSGRAPFYMTSKKYGVYVETTAQGRYELAKMGTTSFSFRDSQLKYDFIYGPAYADILNRYNAIAGASFMPPLWAFSSIWWRDDNHYDLRDAANAQQKVIQDADRLRTLHLPASVIWLDRPFGTGEMGWGNMDWDASFPAPKKMVNDLKDRGMYLIIWIANRCWNSLYLDASEQRYLYRRFEGVKGSAADVSKPEAYEWFQERLNTYVQQGVRGYKIDRGEENEMPPSAENLNAILFPKLSAEGLRNVYGNDSFVFSRNANDTARRYTALWNGDTRPSFGGLRISIKTGLRSGAINFPMWGSDTGGYLGERPTKELVARWLEFSAFSPMLEILIGPHRTPWYDYDDELVKITQTYVSLHHDLIPYVRSSMYQATQTGMPVMRSLIFAYPADESLSDTWDEYLYGQDILVAPVVTSGATERKVYLPAGQWLDYNDKKTVLSGPATITAAAPLATIPLFVREGAIIPRGDILKANNNWDHPWLPKLRIEIFASNKSASRFDYFTGEAVRAINATPTGDGVTVKFDDLGANGTLEVYCGKPSAVTQNGKTLQPDEDYHYDPQAQKLSIPFQGATTLVLSGTTSLFGVGSH